MPLFLIPIAAGAYMYYEKRKKELEEEQSQEPEDQSSPDGKTFPDMRASEVSNDCSEVIETHLSQETGEETTSISQQVEVTFEGTHGVPDRRESDVSDDGGSSSDEGIEIQSTIEAMSSDHIEMTELKKTRSQGPLTSFRNFFREHSDRGRVRDRDVRVVTREDAGSTCVMQDEQLVPLPKISFK